MSLLRRSEIRWLVAILVVLVLVHLGAAYHARATFFSTGDQSYDDIAEELLHGHGFNMNGHPYVDNPPVYPLFVAAAFGALGHDWWSLGLFQTLVDAVSAVLLFALGRRLFGTAAGLLAAAGFALYPYLASQGAQIMDTNIFICAFLAFLYCTVRAAEDRSLAWGAAAGATAGLAFLIRPPVAVVALFFPAIAAILGANRRDIVRTTAAAVVVGLIVIAPWTIRNAVDYHAFVPGAAKAGINFWKGNSPYAAQYISDGISVDLLPEHAGTPQPPPNLNAVQEDAWWRHQAVDWIRAHPGAWAHALWVKLVAFWTWDLNPHTGGDAGTKNALYEATYGPLLALALLGAALGWSRGVRRRGVAAIMLVIVVFTAVHVLTVGYTRLRAPLDPLLMLLAAVLLVELAGVYARTRRVQAATPRAAEPGSI
jgi:4-amino-4-deoxy-L-arabinose transferase-like glycosyltransferase